jgi:hypothetical protein
MACMTWRLTLLPASTTGFTASVRATRIGSRCTCFAPY